MPYATAQFLQDPLAFMQENIIVPHHANIDVDQQSARIHELCLAKGGAQGKKHGRNLDVWILRKRSDNDPGKEGFFVYWCPYNQNETLSCTLGNGARYMFTATMDGCSFGVGSQATGVCRVAHSNEARFGANKEATFGLGGARQFQRDEQQNRLTSILGSNASIINPLHYMPDHDNELILKSTTFGLHTLGQNWSFYTQRYWKNGNTYFLREVTQQI